MSVERFNVVLQGSTLHGQDITTVAAELAGLIKRDIDLALSLLRGQPTQLKSGVDAETGARYVEALERIGVAVRLEPETLEVDSDFSAPSPVGNRTQPPSRTCMSQDYAEAVKWLNLAASRFPASQAVARNNAVRGRDKATKEMTTEQIAEAQRLLRGWKPE
ncbi:MAG TPA: hypothetical protein VG425_10240 [Casimicrobiaceae bacterium]|jgi:hypothetical protein|nr:hypothetical protein [Casimicrobiaceae bacterium]